MGLGLVEDVRRLVALEGRVASEQLEDKHAHRPPGSGLGLGLGLGLGFGVRDKDAHRPPGSGL